MTDPVDALVLDLLDWLGAGERTYGEVMEAWKTSCPRLPVWEEANVRGYVTRRHEPGTGAFISVSPAGRRWLADQRAASAARAGDGRIEAIAIRSGEASK